MTRFDLETLGLKFGSNPFNFLDDDAQQWLCHEAQKMKVNQISLVIKGIIEDAYFEDKESKSSVQGNVKKQAIHPKDNSK